MDSPCAVHEQSVHGGQLMENARAAHGLAMGCSWRVCGLVPESPWKILGRSMDRTWTVHGQSTDSPWTFHGQPMESPWTVHGNWGVGVKSWKPKLVQALSVNDY